MLRPGHSGSLEPFEPGSPDRESGILSAKLVDRAILPEQRLPENKFQLRIVVFWNLIPTSTLEDALVSLDSNDLITNWARRILESTLEPESRGIP